MEIYDIMKRLADIGKKPLTESKMAERIEPPIETNPAERGKYAGTDVHELKKELTRVKRQMADYKDHRKPVPAALRGKFSELTFAIRAKQAGGGKWSAIKERDTAECGMYEDDLEEVSRGEYIKQQDTKAEKSGKKSFQAFGQKFSTDEVDESVLDEREFKSKEEFDDRAKPGDTYRGAKGTHIKTKSGVRHERHADDDEQDDSHDDDSKEKRGRGRPKGTKHKTGARGPSGRSKLLKKDAISEADLEEDYDRDEYDEEGEMAKSQSRTIADAAMELQDMLGDDENLPEWVQKKINLAKEYIDSARDYLKANRPEDSDEEMIPERAVSRSQQQAAGIALAAKRAGKKPAGKGAAAAMSKMSTTELEKFAKTKHKGLPDKKQESVEETTVAGSVAPSVAEPAKKGKKGMQFGKGVYENQLRESFDKKLSMISERMDVNVTASSEGNKAVTVTATDEDAEALSQLLALSGLQSSGYHDACPSCGQTACGCEEIEEDYANSPDTVTADEDYMVHTLSGGLNGPKSTGQTTLPVINKDPARQGVMARVQEARDEAESHLWRLYKKVESEK